MIFVINKQNEFYDSLKMYFQRDRNCRIIIMEIHKHFGLETLLKLEKPNIHCVNDVAALVVHWTLTRRGVGCVGLGEKVGENPVRSEVLPAGWSGENGSVYSLVYQDQNREGYLLKAISVDDVLIVSLLSLKTKKTADTNIQPADFIETKEEIVFNNLETLVGKIEAELINKVITKTDSKPGNQKDAKKSDEDTERKEPDHHHDPLLVGGGGRRGRVDPGMPDDEGGFPNIGGADLDPFRGGIMGGGMLMDPRGRGRGLGGGPRWDPVGPGGPGMGGVGGMGPRPRGGGGMNNFGDEMAPPDWNNMYM